MSVLLSVNGMAILLIGLAPQQLLSICYLAIKAL